MAYFIFLYSLQMFKSVWAWPLTNRVSYHTLRRSSRHVLEYSVSYPHLCRKSDIISSSIKHTLKNLSVPTKNTSTTLTTTHLSKSNHYSDDGLTVSDDDDDPSIDTNEFNKELFFDSIDIQDEDLSDDDDEEEEDITMDGLSIAMDTETEAVPPNPSHLLYNALITSLEKALGSIEKKNNSLINELDKAKNLESTMKRANLILSNLYRISHGMTKVEVEDWDDADGRMITIVLDHQKYNTAQEEADALFAAARKMKRGSRVVEELLSELEEPLRTLQDAHLRLIEMRSIESYDLNLLQSLQLKLERTSSKTGFRMLSDPLSNTDIDKKKSRTKQSSKMESTRYQPTFRKFTSPNGCDILVGRSRRENEAICFQMARDNDIWMHARGSPGAHVLLLQGRRGKTTPTEDCLQFAANLAIFYSDARSERKAEVTTAEPKHILKPRGAPLGAVKLRKEGKTLIGRPQDVPQECKDAREESGLGWEETGSKKAENRKWTKEKTEEVIAKIRADKRAKKNRRSNEEGIMNT